MQKFHLLVSLSLLACLVTLPPFVSCLSHEDISGQKSTRHNIHRLSPKMKSEVALHGVLLWVSMGFLAPLGILIIRMSNREKDVKRRKLFFYLHLILQALSVLLATSGAIMSIKSFDNSFDNNHQRIGLALYCAVWVQAVIGFLRPLRGSKRRSKWYLLHWMLGTVTSLVGIINIYTGLDAYHKKVSRNTRIWNILFTAQIFFMGFFYLFQEKWEYMQKQGMISGNETIETTNMNQLITHTESQKVLAMVPESCAKNNALKNLFD
ncbi:hypothetical protein JCGZ_04603 [Jatropha curcas]|uniref:Cytochrome b561 domain-containing protein n=1 Tax=Jatropha curcas TaxID=180498 RepID=A0A067L0E0_JATCU|nr:cytochrome b561 domain-containing protein At4g18260 [Jatropha curcas]KDP37960.1 hypothetical protein JCGZ_04603 [Jatropha curcas]